MATDQLSPAGGATYNSQTLHVGDGTWDATKDDFLLPNIQGLNFDTMRYNGMGNRFATISEYHTLIIGHGIMAVITFLVVVPAAILIASFYYRNPRLALRLHIYLQILTVILSTVVFVLGYFAVGPSRSLTNPHHGIGVAIYVLVLIQAIGGALIHRIEKGKQRYYLPIKLMLHQWLGRAIALLAIAQIPIGLTLYGSPKYLFILYALTIAALVLLYFILTYRRNKRASYDYDEASSILTASQIHVNGGNSQQYPARGGRDDFLASAMGGAGLAALRRRFSGSRKLQKKGTQNVPPAGGVAQSGISYDDQSYISEEKYRQNRTWRNRLFGTAAGVGVFEGFRRFVDPRHNHSEVSDYTTTSLYQQQAHGGRPQPANQGQRPMTGSELAFAQAEEGRIPQQNDDWTRVEAMEAAQAAAAARDGQTRMNTTTNTTYTDAATANQQYRRQEADYEATQANQQYGRQETQYNAVQQANQQYGRQEARYDGAQTASEAGGHFQAAQANQQYRRQEPQYPAGYNQSEASHQRSSGVFGKILAATGIGALLERRRRSRHEHELDAGSGRQHNFDQRLQDNEHQPLVQPHQNHPGASIPNVQESPVRNNTHGERLYGPNSVIGEQARPPNFNTSTVTAQPPEPPVHQQDFAYPRASPLPAVQTNTAAADTNLRTGPPRDPSLGPPRDPTRNPHRNTSRVAFNLDSASEATHSAIASTQRTASPSRHSNSTLSTAAHPPVALHVRQSLDHVHIRRLSPEEAAIERRRAHAHSRIDPIASPVLVANQNQSSPRPMGPAAVYHIPPPQQIPTASPVAVGGAGPSVSAHMLPAYASPAHTSPRPLDVYAQMSSPSVVAADAARHDAARQQRRRERMQTEAARQGVFVSRNGGTEFT